MSMTNPTSPDAGEQAQKPVGGAAVQPVQGRDITGRFLAQNGAAAETSGNDGEPKPLSGEVLVDWGGVQRRVPAEDLVRMAMNAETETGKAKALAEAAKAQLIKNEAVLALAKRYESMQPEQRRAFEQFVQDPSAFVPKRRLEEDPFFTPEAQPNATLPPEVAERLAALENGFQTAASLLTQIGMERETQTLQQRVTSLMADLPVFSAVPEALVEQARGSVLTRLAMDPKQDVEQLVLDAAKKAMEVHQSYGSGLAPTARAVASNGTTQQPKFNAADLTSGRVKEALRKHMAGG